MKKKIIYVVMFITLLFTCAITTEATEIDAKDIAPGTYVIGKYEFTREKSESYNGRLTARHIMLAAKTIEGNTLDDMVIYYKLGDGSYIDSLTGEAVEAPETFEIVNKNMEIFLLAPILSPGKGGYTDGVLQGTINIVGEGAYALGTNNISGVEFYEKNGEELTLIEYSTTFETEIEVNLGEEKTYVARVYALNSNNQKVYSDYSNEFVIDLSEQQEDPEINLTTPTLSSCKGGPGFGYLSINCLGYADIDLIDGWELYEVINNEKVLIGEAKPNEEIEQSADIGETRTFVARVYALNSNNQKVYSDYSNESVLENYVS